MSSIDPAAFSFDDLIRREWLITNGAGGFASSTILGLNTRKYHGLLVSAARSPVRRMVILSRVEEVVAVGGRSWPLATVEYPGVIHPAGYGQLRAFNPLPYPRWAFQGDGWTLEKSVRFSPGAVDDVVVTYTLLGGGDGEGEPVDLELRPLFALRPIHELMYQWSGRLEVVLPGEPSGPIRVPATARTPEVHFAHDGQFEPRPDWYLSNIYRRERERGYSGLEDLWMPGIVRFRLRPGKPVHFAASLRQLDLPRVLADLQAQESARARAEAAGTARLGEATGTAPAADQAMALRLADASEQFCVNTPPGDAPSSGWTCLLPQFPWTPLAVRDMLIALPGVLLLHGKYASARAFLERLASLLRDGLIPSELSEQSEEPAYNACDTSLWFIHAVHQYVQASGDVETAGRLMPAVAEIISAYCGGTGLGIGLDTDGLLRARAPGVGCTWMNVKLGDWVITPRHGRAVEVNALWHNALGAAAALVEQVGDAARDPGGPAAGYRSAAGRHRAAFNARFWNESIGCCFDVVYDAGVDSAVRPNQVLAASLPFPVLDETRWRPMLQVVRERLLTPYGLRTLAPGDPSYQGRYAGDVVSRDRAYHQGSVFPWLLGPYLSAVARAYGRSEATVEQARRALGPCLDYLRGDGLGTLPELFDGDPPHRPGGAVADARSVGEVARAWAEEVIHPSTRRLPNGPRKAQLAGSSAPAIG